MSTNAEFMTKFIADRLAGGTIRNAMTDGDEYFGFEVVVKAKGRGNYDVLQVWVNCDAEGNGPGWLDVEEAEPEPKGQTVIYCDENSPSKSEEWRAGYRAGRQAADRVSP